MLSYIPFQPQSAYLSLGTLPRPLRSRLAALNQQFRTHRQAILHHARREILSRQRFRRGQLALHFAVVPALETESLELAMEFEAIARHSRGRILLAEPLVAVIPLR